MFTDEEIAYLKSQPLARVATVSEDGQPDVAPVGFEFDGEYLYIGGIDVTKTRKYRNIRAGNEKVAIVVDDLVATSPWTPRFVRVYGTAEVVERKGALGSGEYLRVTPTVSWSWNLGGNSVTDSDSAGAPPLRRAVHASAG